MDGRGGGVVAISSLRELLQIKYVAESQSGFEK